MGKRKSAKPQKYIQQSDDDDDDHLDIYDADSESNQVVSLSSFSESDTKILKSKDNLKCDNKDKLCKYEEIHSFSSDNVWKNNLPLSITNKLDGKNELQSFNHLDSSLSMHNSRTKQAVLSDEHLETYSDKLFSSGSFEDRLSDGGHASIFNLSGTESDRRSSHEFDGDQGMRPKRRRKYVTYPATFRLEVVEHAEKNGKSAAAKKYNICVEKVSMWCKTKDNIIHKVKKGGFSLTDGADSYDDKTDELPDTSNREEVCERSLENSEIKEVDEKKYCEVSKDLEMLYNDDSDASEKYELDVVRKQDIVYPPCFKLRVIQSAEEKGERVAAKEYLVCERRVHLWCQAKEVICENTKKMQIEPWECDLYIQLKSYLDKNKRITVRDLIVQAEQAQISNPAPIYTAITTTWLTDWCQKFNIRFNSTLHSIPQPLTEDACLVMETTLYQSDREELQAVQTKGKKLVRIQDLIDASKKTDASASASDREDSFLFSSISAANNKRRRRSYTLAFKLEVVKFAQSHTKHATSRKYGIARRVISRWIADKEVLQSDLLQATQQVLGDANSTAEVDEQLLKWYKELKKRGNFYNYNYIKHQIID